MNWKKTLLLCCLILLIGAGIMAWIFSTEPTAQREGAVRKTAMLVAVTAVEHGDFRPTIVATGTVRAERDIDLSPRVTGEIIARDPAFTPGGRVDRGALLVQIDPADYENLVAQRRSALARAQADLAIEMGRQDVARQDYRLFEEELPAFKENLVLRQPQLQTAEAAVAAAEAALKQAELDLQRTAVRAPFNAAILSRHVDVGSHVDPGTVLGRLVGLDTYWVVTTVPLAQLPMIALPEGPDQAGAEARIYQPAVWPEQTWRSGRVVNLVGALAENTRMARLLVAVADPLALTADHRDQPPLVIGAYVEVHIAGRTLQDVIRLERDYVRSNDTVWVDDNGQLRIRSVNIVFRDAAYAYIDAGLEPSAQVVTTNLRTVTDGVALRRQEAPPAASSADASEETR